MKFATYAINHKAVIYLTIFLLLAGGLAAYQKLGKLEDPTYIVKTAVVVTPYPGAGPYEVEQQVTDVIEKAAQSADEVENIYSISRAGSPSCMWTSWIITAPKRFSSCGICSAGKYPTPGCSSPGGRAVPGGR